MERPDERKVFGMVCILWLLLTLLFVFTVHYPIREEAEAIRRETELVTKEVVSIENFTNKHLNIKGYAEEVGKRHERADRALPNELEQSAVLGMLQRNALNNKVQLVSVSPGQIKKESRLMELPIQIKLSCNYFQLLDFLKTLQDEERFVKLNRLNVRTVDNRLSFEIEAAVYALEEALP